MQTVSEIFEQLGGATAISAETGIPITTVHGWKRSGRLPHWRVEALVSLAEKLGKQLDPSQVPTRGPCGNAGRDREAGHAAASSEVVA